VTADGVCLSDVYADGTFYAPSLSLLRAARRPGGNEMRLDASSFLGVQNPTRDLPGADEEVQMLVRMLAPPVVTNTRLSCATMLPPRQHWRMNSMPVAVSHLWRSTFRATENSMPSSRGSAVWCMANHETLTVSNVMDQQLRNCHLCVLSACDTGRLNTRDKEAVGLTSAFLVAGVRRIVSSLWPVADTATALLIARMYEQLIAIGNCLTRSVTYCSSRRHLVESSPSLGH
jgi:CHAT domain-containing protein